MMPAYLRTSLGRKDFEPDLDRIVITDPSEAEQDEGRRIPDWLMPNFQAAYEYKHNRKR